MGRSVGLRSGKGRARTGCSSRTSPVRNGRPWSCSSTAGSRSIQGSTAPGSTIWYGTDESSSSRGTRTTWARCRRTSSRTPWRPFTTPWGSCTVGVDHVRPEAGQFALIGHSAGANLAAQIAALTADPHTALPKPKALIALMPGEVVPMRQPTLDRIPETTLLIVAVGEEDIVVGDHRGRQIFTEAVAIPPARRRFIFFRSDRHGYPPLIADHSSPTGSHPRLDNGEGLFRSLQMSFGDVNALDRAGFWRMADVTLDAGFAGKTLDEATRDEERFRHLGYWSDGRRVNPPIVSADLNDIPRVIPGNGLKIFSWSSPSKPKVALSPEQTK